MGGTLLDGIGLPHLLKALAVRAKKGGGVIFFRKGGRTDGENEAKDGAQLRGRTP
jgi:hypothetical protein